MKPRDTRPKYWPPCPASSSSQSSGAAATSTLQPSCWPTAAKYSYWPLAAGKVEPVGDTTATAEAPVERCASRLAVSGGSGEHTSGIQAQSNIVCRLLLVKKKKVYIM